MFTCWILLVRSHQRFWKSKVVMSQQLSTMKLLVISKQLPNKHTCDVTVKTQLWCHISLPNGSFLVILRQATRVLHDCNVTAADSCLPAGFYLRCYNCDDAICEVIGACLPKTNLWCHSSFPYLKLHCYVTGRWGESHSWSHWNWYWFHTSFPHWNKVVIAQ